MLTAAFPHIVIAAIFYSCFFGNNAKYYMASVLLLLQCYEFSCMDVLESFCCFRKKSFVVGCNLFDDSLWVDCNETSFCSTDDVHQQVSFKATLNNFGIKRAYIISRDIL